MDGPYLMLVADADLPEPVMKALRAVRYPIARYSDLGLPVRPAGALTQKMLEPREHRRASLGRLAVLLAQAKSGPHDP